MVVIDAKDYADMRLRSLEAAQAMSPEALTMKQLGSYIPNFKPLSGKPDSFKNAIGAFCMNTMKSNEWQYLITHMKQDQVNTALFTEGKTVVDPFIRGSINGIYIVADQISTLGMGYEERMNKDNP